MANISPALRHRARMLAERTAGAAAPLGVTTGTAYDLMLYKLSDDRRRLKSIQSVERKIEVKATLLPDYAQWIDGGAGGNGHGPVETRARPVGVVRRQERYGTAGTAPQARG